MLALGSRLLGDRTRCLNQVHVPGKCIQMMSPIMICSDTTENPLIHINQFPSSSRRFKITFKIRYLFMISIYHYFLSCKKSHHEHSSPDTSRKQAAWKQSEGKKQSGFSKFLFFFLKTASSSIPSQSLI